MTLLQAWGYGLFVGFLYGAGIATAVMMVWMS